MPAISSLLKKAGSGSKKIKLFFVLFLFFLVAIPIFLSTKRPTPNEQAATQIQSIIQSLSKKVDLPNGTPNVYTVSDVTKLKSEAFFAKAKNGDKVLIYASAKKAFLYRPSEDKLIEVAYYNPPEPTKAVAGTSTSITPTITSTPTPTITLTPIISSPSGAL